MCFGGKVDSEIVQLSRAPGGANGLPNIEFILAPFSPKTFHKTNQICIFNHINASFTKILSSFWTQRYANKFESISGKFTSDVIRIDNDLTFEFHAIVELLCKALRIGTISLRNVRGLLIDFNKPTVTMTFYVWKSNRQKGKKEDNSAKTKDVHMSATNPSF